MAVGTSQVSVGHTTAAAIIAASTASPNYSEGSTEPNRFMTITNAAGAAVYLGADSTVTSLTGYSLAAAGSVQIWLHPDEAIYAIAASGTQVVSYLITGN